MMIVYLTLWAHLLIVSDINFINHVLYDEYIYINVLCKLNKMLSTIKTFLLNHY